MNVTIDEIAKLANVSKTTVSRVLNNKPDVKPETREKIVSLIAKYDYQPNAFAQAINRKTSRTIGLIMPYEAEYIFSNPFYSEIIRGVSTEINKRDYYLLFCYSDKDNYIDIFKQQRVEGFVLLSPGKSHKEIAFKLKNVNAPFISTSKMPGESNFQYVDVDNVKGASLAIEHLILLGHRQIGFINGPEGLASSEDRLLGYRNILNKYQIPLIDGFIKFGIPSIESGFQSMKKLLEYKNITAVFAASDMEAFGAIRAIKKSGKKVPDDISVVGFDDIPLADSFDLTTIKQPIFKKGQMAAKLLIDLFEQKATRKIKELPVELVVRSSTKAR